MSPRTCQGKSHRTRPDSGPRQIRPCRSGRACGHRRGRPSEAARFRWRRPPLLALPAVRTAPPSEARPGVGGKGRGAIPFRALQMGIRLPRRMVEPLRRSRSLSRGGGRRRNPVPQRFMSRLTWWRAFCAPAPGAAPDICRTAPPSCRAQGPFFALWTGRVGASGGDGRPLGGFSRSPVAAASTRRFETSGDASPLTGTGYLLE